MGPPDRNAIVVEVEKVLERIELVDPDEYDFEMNNFMERFGQLQFSELKTD